MWQSNVNSCYYVTIMKYIIVRCDRKWFVKQQQKTLIFLSLHTIELCSCKWCAFINNQDDTHTGFTEIIMRL